MKPKIYFAGPLFSLAEKMFNRQLCSMLREEGYEVFLPQESPENKTRNPAAIFLSDDEAVKNCDVILAIVDGADADSGTCWEHGRGYSLGKQLLCVRTDFRRIDDTTGRPFNLMIYDSTMIRRGRVLEYYGDSIHQLKDLIFEELKLLEKK